MQQVAKPASMNAMKQLPDTSQKSQRTKLSPDHEKCFFTAHEYLSAGFLSWWGMHACMHGSGNNKSRDRLADPSFVMGPLYL